MTHLPTVGSLVCYWMMMPTTLVLYARSYACCTDSAVMIYQLLRACGAAVATA
jgi:hypothetical protein